MTIHLMDVYHKNVVIVLPLIAILILLLPVTAYAFWKDRQRARQPSQPEAPQTIDDDQRESAEHAEAAQKEERLDRIKEMLAIRKWPASDEQSTASTRSNSDDTSLCDVGISAVELPEKEGTAECLICLHVLEGGQSVAESKNTACGHIYHAVCLEHWLLKNDSCPTCRATYFVETV